MENLAVKGGHATWLAAPAASGRGPGLPLLFQLAVRAARHGQVWIAEAGTTPKRFSVWKTGGPQPALVREIFGPLDLDEPAPTPDPSAPTRILAQGCAWRIDAQNGKVKCVEVMSER